MKYTGEYTGDPIPRWPTTQPTQTLQDMTDQLSILMAAVARIESGIGLLTKQNSVAIKMASMDADTAPIRLIMEIVADYYELPYAALRGPKRAKKYSHPRMFAMALAHEFTGCSTTQIGRAFKKDHTTILNGIRRSRELCYQSEYATEWAILKHIITDAFAEEGAQT